MLDFDTCSFAKVDQEQAEEAYLNHLSFLENEMDANDRDVILSAVSSKYSTIMDFFKAPLNDISELADSMKDHRDYQSSRMVVLWFLACLDHDKSRRLLITALRHQYRLARYSGAVVREQINAAIVSWSEPGAPSEVNYGIEASMPKDMVTERPRGLVVVNQVGDANSNDGKNIRARYKRVVGREVGFNGSISSLGELVAQLRQKFPWADNVVDTVAGQLALLSRNPQNASRPCLPPILLVGPPGCGKTKLLTTLMGFIGIPFSLIPCGGTADSGGLQATSRGWSTPRACGPVQTMLEHECANPGVILDELDKASVAGQSMNGSVTGALLSMMNANGIYYDGCLMANVNLSKVSFLATANSIERIPEELLDRFLVIDMAAPGIEHFDAIYEVLRDEEAQRLELAIEDLPEVEDWQIADLRKTLLTEGSSLRIVTRTYRKYLADAALLDHQDINQILSLDLC